MPTSPTLAGQISTGPGDVLYGTMQSAVADLSLVAIALSRDRAGRVVASAPISILSFAEAPAGVLGHGAVGIIDRRTGTLLLGYVDVMGAPTSIGRAVHTVGTILGDVGSSDVVVRDPDGKHDWHLAIRRDPTSPGFSNGEAPRPRRHMVARSCRLRSAPRLHRPTSPYPPSRWSQCWRPTELARGTRWPMVGRWPPATSMAPS